MAPLAVVTGGSSGLGRAIASELAHAGFELHLLARSSGPLSQAVDELRSAGASAECSSVDLTDETAVLDFFRSLDQSGTAPQVWVNCAGVARFGEIARTTGEEWRQLLDLNLSGLFYCCRESAIRMSARGRGDIVNILSVAAHEPLTGAGAYCASKWGALAVTRILANEVRRQGVRVTAISPGAVDTPLWDDLPHEFERREMLDPAEVARVVRQVVELPRSLYIDEVRIMPPRGML